VERLRTLALKGQRPRTVPVTAALPANAVAAETAYEIAWSGRQESPRAQVAFEDLTGWTARAMGDTEVALSASVERRLWRPQLAKFSYKGGSGDTVVEIRPPEPILIPGRFDAANLWLHGAWDRVRDPQLRVSVGLEDQAGRPYEIELGSITASYWGLQHGLLHPKAAATARLPMRFVALHISNCRTADERHAYLESLAFYPQNRKPVKAPGRSRFAVFPTSNEGMLPTPPEGAITQVRPSNRGAEFTSVIGGKRLRFQVDPEGGCFSGVTACWDDGPRFHPLAAGGLTFPPGQAGGELTDEASTLVAAALTGECLTARWRLLREGRPLEWEASYAVRGCTLVLDVRCAGGEATGLVVGQVTGLPQPRGIEVPYLLLGPKPGPWVACSDGLFVSVLPDWYHSHCSSIDTQVSRPQDDRIGLLRGTTYQPLSDGRRNPLRERILVSVSREFADVLPNSRNPASPRREALAPYLFFMADQLCPNLYRTLKRYGMDHIIGTDFAAILVANNYGEGFAGRWRPHPTLTLEQVRGYRRGIKALGYLFGTYGDFTDFFPGHEAWDEAKVVLGPDGDFVDGWWGNYLMKPALMPDLVRRVGRQAKRAYPSDCIYLDVHTNRGPQALDFEAGAPGAGIARDQVIANGDCILEARRAYGSTISEGYYRWLYAGLADMDYATLITTGTAADLPPLVDFDLLKIHPFQHGTMMGHHPDRFLSSEDQAPLYQDTGRDQAPIGFYKYVSASLAYGHMLILGYWYVPPPARFIQYYALMQGIQKEYLTDVATGIRYHDGKALLPTSHALASGAQQLGRVWVQYSRGLRLWVNYNPTTPWTVECSGRAYDLPAYGWLAEKPGAIQAYSALIDGQRVDAVRCPEYHYLRTGAVRVSEGPLDVAGTVWLKRAGKAWRLLPCGDLGPWERFPAEGLPERFSDYRPGEATPERGCRYVAVDLEALLGRPAAEARISARDADGNPLPANVRWLDERWVQFLGGESGLDYRIE
jgi:hypothetical protein